MSKTYSEGDLRACEVNAEKVMAGGKASAAHWAETAHKLVANVREAREWVGRLTSQTRVLTCAFCGEAYPPGTPETNHDRLTAHVLACPKHPIRQMQEALNRALEDCATLRDQRDELARCAAPAPDQGADPLRERDGAVVGETVAEVAEVHGSVVAMFDERGRRAESNPYAVEIRCTNGRSIGLPAWPGAKVGDKVYVRVVRESRK